MEMRLIERRTIFDGKDGVFAYHSGMFHGSESGGFQIYDNNLDDSETGPLHIDKNLWMISPLIKPSRNFLVSSQMRQLLQELPSVGFLPVVFEKVFFRECVVDDISQMPDPYYNIRSIVRQIPHNSRLDIPSYWEVRTFRIDQVLVKHASSASIILLTEPNGVFSHEIPLCSEIVMENPILWTPCGILVAPCAWHVLEPAMDFRYFRVSCFSLDN